MLLGQSVFQSVLTRLEDEQEDAEEIPATAANFQIRGLGAGFVTPDGRPAAADTDGTAYFDHLTEWLEQKPDGQTEDKDTEIEEQQPAVPVMPPHLERLSEAEIAEDLAISQADGEATLNEKRRQFAKRNHPDRVAPECRENATTRMKIANRLIDKALSSLHRG